MPILLWLVALISLQFLKTIIAAMARYTIRIFCMGFRVFRFWGHFLLLTLFFFKSATKASNAKMTQKLKTLLHMQKTHSV